MFRNYLKTALRNLRKNKFDTAISLAGLSIGIACWILILLWSGYEDAANKTRNMNQELYRIGRSQKELTSWYVDEDGNDQHKLYPETPVFLARTLSQNFTAIKDGVRFGYIDGAAVKKEDGTFSVDKFAFADTNVFNFFRFLFIEGSEKTAFSKPNSVIITKRAAEKYFKGENPIGKEIAVNGPNSFRVSAVIKNIPYYYKLQFDFLIPLASILNEYNHPNWASNEVNTYITLNKDVDPDSLAHAVNAFATGQQPGLSDTFLIKPLPVMNVYSDIRKSTISGTDSLYIYIFSVAALLILGIACLNYSNLTIAGFKNRAREIGVRKVYGALRKDIIIQYLAEAMILAFGALIIALAIVIIALPGFNHVAGKHFVFTFSELRNFLPELLVITIFTGLASGVYPAFYISSLTPVKILTGNLRAGSGSDMFRKLFLYIQCSISISMIIASFFVNYQLDHLRNKREGYEEYYWVRIPFYGGMKNRFEEIKPDMMKDRNIFQVLNKDGIEKEGSMFSAVDEETREATGSDFLYLKIRSLYMPNSIKHIERAWYKYNPDYPFEYTFIDKSLSTEFKSEQRMSSLFNYLTVLIIVLTSFGLFTMSAYISFQRRREVAIRKTLGASTLELYYLIMKEFLGVLLLSNFTAYFTALVMSTNWVYKFSTRISISYEPFLIGTAISFCLLFASVSYNAIKSALTNPADILRYE